MIKLTLTLEAAESGVFASLVEEWDGLEGRQRMAPRIRHFETSEDAFSWARSLARREGLSSLYLIDARDGGPRPRPEGKEE